MRFYIDKENMLSLLKSEDKLFLEDVIKVFRNQVDIALNFSKDEILSNELIKAFFSKMTYGRKREKAPMFLDERFPERPLCNNLHTTLNSFNLKNGYLVNDENCDNTTTEGALAIKNKGQELNLFNQLVFGKSDYDFEKKMNIGGDEFNKWEDLKRFTMPFTDLLLIDQFVFSDASLIESNYIPCLKSLHANKCIQTNIIVYTDHDQFVKGGRSFKNIEKQTKEAVETITGIKPTFTLILVRKQRGQKSFSEHDRTIWTNYLRIYTGDSFNHFNSRGEKISTGREIHLSSHLKDENRKVSNKLIEDIQSNIKMLGGKSSAQIKGDCVSGILNF